VNIKISVSTPKTINILESLSFSIEEKGCEMFSMFIMHKITNKYGQISEKINREPLL